MVKLVSVFSRVSVMASVIGLAGPAFADGAKTNAVGDKTFAATGQVQVNVRHDDGGIAGECGPLVYDSGDASSVGSGRTVGGPGFDFTVIQPFILAEDTTVCSLGLDGWVVIADPPTFNGSIYPPDPADPTKPDMSSPLTGADFALPTDPFSIHWVDMPVEPVCLLGGAQYYMATREAPGHWSAIYNAANGDTSYSIFNGDFSTRYYAPPIAMRIRGNAGCGSACVPCDTNCDGSINQFDIQPFINVLTGGESCSPCAADANGDGSVNQFDIQGFVECLGG